MVVVQCSALCGLEPHGSSPRESRSFCNLYDIKIGTGVLGTQIAVSLLLKQPLDEVAIDSLPADDCCWQNRSLFERFCQQQSSSPQASPLLKSYARGSFEFFKELTNIR